MQRALLVIDVQNDYFQGRHTITHPKGSFEKILLAMDAAQAAGMPVVLVQHCAIPSVLAEFQKGSPGWQFPEEVASRQHSLVVEKELPGSFTNTPLEAWLRAHSIDTVVIAGYMTQMCCDTTARQALHLGFQVEFLSDATGTHDFSNAAGSVTAEELHRAALVTQASRFSKVMTAGEWANAISG